MRTASGLRKSWVRQFRRNRIWISYKLSKFKSPFFSKRLQQGWISIRNELAHYVIRNTGVRMKFDKNPFNTWSASIIWQSQPIKLMDSVKLSKQVALLKRFSSNPNYTPVLCYWYRNQFLIQFSYPSFECESLIQNDISHRVIGQSTKKISHFRSKHHNWLMHFPTFSLWP